MQYTEGIYFTLSLLHKYKRSQSSLAWLSLGIRMAVTLSIHLFDLEIKGEICNA